MKKRIGAIFTFVLFLSVAHAVHAGQITIVAEDIKGKAVRNVRFSCLRTGAVSAPTTTEGRTKLPVPDELKPGQRRKYGLDTSAMPRRIGFSSVRGTDGLRPQRAGTAR